LETSLREEESDVYLIAYEREILPNETIVNLQGKQDCKYVVLYRFSPKFKRLAEATGWPATPEDNLERLEDAGIVMERNGPYCRRCKGKYRTC
jgi:hypothetical protein